MVICTLPLLSKMNTDRSFSIDFVSPPPSLFLTIHISFFEIKRSKTPAKGGKLKKSSKPSFFFFFFLKPSNADQFFMKPTFRPVTNSSFLLISFLVFLLWFEVLFPVLSVASSVAIIILFSCLKVI